MRTATIPQADPTLTTQMKSLGETMAIGRNFKDNLQKCLRSLEIGRTGLGGDGKPWRIGTENHLTSEHGFHSAADQLLNRHHEIPRARRQR